MTILRILTSAFAIKALGSALAVLMFVAIGRASTLTAFGDFAFGFAAAQFFAVFFGMGAETVALRATSAKLASGADDDARAQAALGLKITMIGVAGAVALGIIAVLVGLPASFALSISALAALLAISETLSAILRGYGGVTTALVPREIYWRLAGLILAGLAGALGIRLSAGQWLWVAAITLGVALAMQWLRFDQKPQRADLGRIAPDDSRLVPYLARHWQLWVLAILNGFGTQIPIFLVRTIMDAEATALLFAAMKITAVIALPLVAVGPVVAPQISRAWAMRDMARLQMIGAQSATFTTLGALIGFALIVVAGPQLLGLFGTDYAAAQSATVILAIGQLFAALVGPTGFAMLMMGHERVALIYLASASAVSLMLTLVLTVIWGISGAAVGISTLILVNKAACYVYLVRKHAVHLSIIGWVARPPQAAGAS